MGFFGSDSKRTTAQTATADQRVAVEGSIGTLLSPGASLAGTAAISAQPFSTVSQVVTNEGLTGEDVEVLLSMLVEDRASERSAVTSLGQSMASGLIANASQTADILAATKAPDSTTLTQLMPLLLLVALAYFWMK